MIGIAATAALLVADWIVAGEIVSLFSPIPRAGALFIGHTPAQLVADILVCITLDVLLMYVVQLRSRPHGTFIAVSMGFFSWAVYFTEVGYFSGMLDSEYPWWYEWITFFKEPLAFALSFYLRSRQLRLKTIVLVSNNDEAPAASIQEGRTMTRLQRYNEMLLAVAGTVFVLAVALVMVAVFVATLRPATEHGLAVPTGNVAKKPHQELVFCAPSFVEGSDYQYFPVAVVSSTDASATPALASGSSRLYSRSSYLTECGLKGYSDATRVFNVVVRNSSSGEQHLLLEHAGQIESVKLPDRKCAEGAGDAPCGTLIWSIRKVDTNHDGLLNGEDAVVDYVSDLSAASLRAVTPADATVLATSWDFKSGEILFQVRRDTNSDGKYSSEDGAELLAISSRDDGAARTVIESSIVKNLQDAVR